MSIELDHAYRQKMTALLARLDAALARLNQLAIAMRVAQ